MFFLSFSMVSAQPTIQWQKTYGGSYFDEIWSLDNASDGGTFAVGFTESNNGDISGFNGVIDFWVIRLNGLGELKWEVALGGSGIDWPREIKKTNDGGCIVVGYTQSEDGDVSFNHGNKDAWVVKLTSNGDIEWQKALGGSDWDEAWSVSQTSDGGYIIAGQSNSIDGDAQGNTPIFLDVWVVRLTDSGEILWQKNFGGSSEEYARSILPSVDGGYWVLGSTKSEDGDVTNQHGNVDVWLLKLNSNGDLEWQKTYGGCCADYGRSVYETNEEIFICGQAGSSDGDVTGFKGFGDMWVIKTTKTGEILWEKTLGGSNADNALSGSPLPDGGFIVGGHTKSMDGDITEFKGIQDIWVARLKADGNILWQKSIGGSDGESCYAINQTSDGGFILGGNTWSTDGDVTGSIIRGQNDFWVVKLGPETVGLESSTQQELSIAPNPVADVLTIAMPESGAAVITVFNATGQVTLQSRLSASGSVNVSGLPPGLYLLRLNGLDGRLYVGQFVKG